MKYIYKDEKDITIIEQNGKYFKYLILWGKKIKWNRYFNFYDSNNHLRQITEKEYENYLLKIL